ncbi:TetR/AcrR family transcriptional regulator [Spiractinospora alimapuensis]|uniref:TetR/AcrR family transcriptional regulator n=1 Tax=Spiractinospora alimapuensis TaxID=2820884 RepID=UPI001F46A957|nr:TetR/AcrR family transcriptional regulator [Spiractinospora alimapuensis]QVQ54507.1 TetR/AcrR family transcriptional regulator [Spiractinospora alimapuensis]
MSPDPHPIEQPTPSGRVPQAKRRARTREALLRAAALGLSRKGFRNLTLEEVAKDAGYTRGALYHLFKDKQELTLAVIEWIFDLWNVEVRSVVEQETDPVQAFFAFARAHAVYYQRDVARVTGAMVYEFANNDHPVGRAVAAAYTEMTDLCVDLVRTGRARGLIPASGPSDRVTAFAAVGAAEGVILALRDDPPYNQIYAVRAVAGVLGVEPPDEPELAGR